MTTVCPSTVARGQAQRFFNRHHFHRTARQFQRAAIRMARIAQRVGGLVQNRVARHQPENHRALGAHEIPSWPVPPHGRPARFCRRRSARAGRHRASAVSCRRRSPECKALAGLTFCAQSFRGTPLRDAAPARQCGKNRATNPAPGIDRSFSEIMACRHNA